MTIRCVVTDLDGTLLGKPDAVMSFSQTWNSMGTNHNTILCFNTGRLVHDVLALLQDSNNLLNPDYVIGGIGTEIYDVKNNHSLHDFSETLQEGWNIHTVEGIMKAMPKVERQPQCFQTPFKSSWFYDDANTKKIDAIKEKLQHAGLMINVIYSCSHYLDIVPQRANKGNATSWLLQKLHIAPHETVVAGDSGNDTSMFLVNDIHGIVVENAQPELFAATVHLPNVYKAQRAFADGLLEGLCHFGPVCKVEHATLGNLFPANDFEPEIIRLFEKDAFQEPSQADADFLDVAYEKALIALKKNITPLGFSACSLNDNVSIGTDINYRSVWGRDGAIAILGSLSVDDETIRQCCRNTLTTLLKHVSENGQVPNNVRIDTGVPDYSGEGKICSIDSGLWVLIAFYAFINKTNDMAFLAEYMDTLQRVMHWLSAHDSNNDALLEIPEAGDWTDLFGRSYNVLYDEVLWYKANISFGKMLELLEHYSEASRYFRIGQAIKTAINLRFWPNTQNDIFSTKFFEAQYALGDTRYLLAQVTPFSFNWRCDIYGNILAFIYNVLDSERAKLSFRFMWEVGVNNPFPVKNLYPVVHEGDSDWRSYYTVNLLNLPHHYHNGGIWPFIGALWVMFINRLGLKDIAYQELLHLARLNQQGKTFEWEFNEWCHGQTGKPMGKAFQAWSASSFISAYADLKKMEEPYDV